MVVTFVKNFEGINLPWLKVLIVTTSQGFFIFTKSYWVSWYVTNWPEYRVGIPIKNYVKETNKQWLRRCNDLQGVNIDQVQEGINPLVVNWVTYKD